MNVKLLNALALAILLWFPSFCGAQEPLPETNEASRILNDSFVNGVSRRLGYDTENIHNMKIKTKKNYEYIINELSKQKDIIEYVSNHPSVVDLTDVVNVNSYYIAAKRVKLSSLISMLSALGAPVVMSPSSNHGNLTLSDLRYRGENIKNILTDISSKGKVPVKYFKYTGYYVVE